MKKKSNKDSLGNCWNKIVTHEGGIIQILLLYYQKVGILLDLQKNDGTRLMHKKI